MTDKPGMNPSTGCLIPMSLYDAESLANMARRIRLSCQARALVVQINAAMTAAEKASTYVFVKAWFAQQFAMEACRLLKTGWPAQALLDSSGALEQAEEHVARAWCHWSDVMNYTDR